MSSQLKERLKIMEIIRERCGRYGAMIIVALTMLVWLSATQVRAQDNAYTFSKDAPEQTIGFLTTNPYTKASGSMTITLSGAFKANRLTEPMKLGISYISGDQKGTFVFTPDDPGQPTISGKYQFGLSGETFPQTDTIDFFFKMDGAAKDGSRVTFIQGERAMISEGVLVITFGETRRLIENNSPDKPGAR